MGFTICKCPQCGAELNVDSTKEFMTCSFCGSKVIREQEKTADWYTDSIVYLMKQGRFDYKELLSDFKRNFPTDERAIYASDLAVWIKQNGYDGNFFTYASKLEYPYDNIYELYCQDVQWVARADEIIYGEYATRFIILNRLAKQYGFVSYDEKDLQTSIAQVQSKAAQEKKDVAARKRQEEIDYQNRRSKEIEHYKKQKIVKTLVATTGAWIKRIIIAIVAIIRACEIISVNLIS